MTNTVITSYSIHYTKLYDPPDAALPRAGGRTVRRRPGNRLFRLGGRTEGKNHLLSRSRRRASRNRTGRSRARGARASGRSPSAAYRRRYARADRHVITSYSIHYTKLYDLRLGAVRIQYSAAAADVLGYLQLVITSYSIHYTKLYDPCAKTP